MCRSENLNIHNVKFHFLLSHQDANKVRKLLEGRKKVIVGDGGGKSNLKFCRNFVVLRLHPYTFSIFLRKGHVNATGVRDFECIENSLEEFDKYFSTNIRAGVGPRLERLTVDNSTASGKLLCCSNLRLDKVGKAGGEDKNCPFFVSFRPHFFPGVVFRRRRQRCPSATTASTSAEGDSCRGTAIVFNSRTFIIVGGRRRSEVEQTSRELCAAIHQSMS